MSLELDCHGSIKRYKSSVIRLLKSGKASQEVWNEVAWAVLDASEKGDGDTEAIDRALGFGETLGVDE